VGAVVWVAAAAAGCTRSSPREPVAAPPTSSSSTSRPQPVPPAVVSELRRVGALEDGTSVSAMVGSPTGGLWMLGASAGGSSLFFYDGAGRRSSWPVPVSIFRGAQTRPGLAVAPDGHVLIAVNDRLVDFDPATGTFSDHVLPKLAFANTELRGFTSATSVAVTGPTVYVGVRGAAELVAFDRGTQTFATIDLRGHDTYGVTVGPFGPVVGLNDPATHLWAVGVIEAGRLATVTTVADGRVVTSRGGAVAAGQQAPIVIRPDGSTSVRTGSLGGMAFQPTDQGVQVRSDGSFVAATGDGIVVLAPDGAPDIVTATIPHPTFTCVLGPPSGAGARAGITTPTGPTTCRGYPTSMVVDGADRIWTTVANDREWIWASS
jgi:hypothetical protein